MEAIVDQGRFDAPQPGPTSLSLEQIENDPWGDAPTGATRLIATTHALRRTPPDALTVEDLRLLIGQHTSLTVLVPRALDSLERDPLIEGDLYPGDLPSAVLQVPADYWTGHPRESTRMRAVAQQAITALAPPTDSVDDELLTRARTFLTNSR
jgi:CDI immunity proteins